MAKSKQEILEMVAKGEINATEAAEMLRAKEEALSALPAPSPVKTVIKMSKEAQADQETNQEDAGKSPRWLRIRVNDLQSGKSRVRVNIPLRLIKLGVKIGRGFVPELNGIDWDETIASMKQSDDGLVVDVEDESSGEHVQIYVE